MSDPVRADVHRMRKIVAVIAAIVFLGSCTGVNPEEVREPTRSVGDGISGGFDGLGDRPR